MKRIRGQVSCGRTVRFIFGNTAGGQNQMIAGILALMECSNLGDLVPENRFVGPAKETETDAFL